MSHFILQFKWKGLCGQKPSLPSIDFGRNHIWWQKEAKNADMSSWQCLDHFSPTSGWFSSSVPLSAFCSSSTSLFVPINLSGGKSKFTLNNNLLIHHIRRYSYLNVVQQSFNIEDNIHEEEEPGAESDNDVDYILYGNETRCKVKKKIIFAKTHKTGSTTLQNILHRFGLVFI